LGWINALVVTTLNALTLTAQSVGFTIAGGTTSKTLTVSGDADVGQDLKSTAGPTFDHIHLTAGQISFPATQSASSDANTLDDYEENTWVPVITPVAGAITSYTIQNAAYTKIGRAVMFNLQFTITDKGTGSGGIIFTLPFTSAVQAAFSGANGNTLKTLSVFVGASSADCGIFNYDGTDPVADNAYRAGGVFFV